MTFLHSLKYFHLINGIFLCVKIFSFDKKICSIKSRDPRRHGHKAFMARSQRALSIKNSGNSGLGSEWKRHFPEFHSEILGVPREVGLKFRKIGITGKLRSIRPFLLGPSFSEPGNRIQRG